MIDTILGILAIILLLDLVAVLIVGSVWFCLWVFTLIDELWDEIKEQNNGNKGE